MRTTSSLPWALLTLISTSATLVAPRPIGACSLATNELHRVDPAFSSDATPPSAVTAAVVDVAHIEDDGDGGGCGSHVASCGSYGVVTVAVSATDDAAPPDRIGYQIRLVSGTPPRDFGVPAQSDMLGASRPFENELIFYFHPDDHDWQVELEIRAVDLNGNLGPPTLLAIVD